MPRVITGGARGLRLKTPSGNNTRPTTDRIKETLFNIIQSNISQSRVLDLFAGSGSLGIEALSRGAKEAHFVDSSNESIKCVKDNLIHTKLDGKANVYKLKYDEALRYFKNNDYKFDLIFLDPPYNKGFLQEALQKIDEMNLLACDGLIVVERDKRDQVVESLNSIEAFRDECYGETTMTFYGFKEDKE